MCSTPAPRASITVANAGGHSDIPTPRVTIFSASAGPVSTPVYAFTTTYADHAPAPVSLPTGARPPHGASFPAVFSTSRDNLLPSLSLGLVARFGDPADTLLPTFSPARGLVAAHWGSPSITPADTSHHADLLRPAREIGR